MTDVEDPGRYAGDSSAHLQSGDPPPPFSVRFTNSAAVTPAAQSTEPVAEQDLVEVETGLCAEDFATPQQQVMAHNLTQRQNDQRFLKLLADADFTGPRWEYFANELAAYAIPVMMAWTRTRKIASLCQAKGRPLRAIPDDWPAEDRLGLTTLTVAKAINVFRDNVLRRERWDPTRGATLKTFFMGAVIQQFPNSYNSWYDEQLRTLTRPGLRALEDTSAISALQDTRPGSDPADTAINRIHLLEVLREMPEDLAIASLLRLDGYKLKDAAAAIGKTEDALSEQYRRFRNGRGRGMR